MVKFSLKLYDISMFVCFVIGTDGIRIGGSFGVAATDVLGGAAIWYDVLGGVRVVLEELDMVMATLVVVVKVAATDAGYG